MQDFESVRPQMRTLQIIAAALIAGLLAFAGIAVFLVHTQGQPANLANALPVLSFVAVGLLIVQVPVWAIFPGFIERGQIARIADGTWKPAANLPIPQSTSFATDEAKLLAVRQMSTMVALTILEGAAFLGCVAYIVEAQWYALAVAGVVLVLMLATFPTEDRVRHWLEKQQLALEDHRRASASQAKR